MSYTDPPDPTDLCWGWGIQLQIEAATTLQPLSLSPTPYLSQPQLCLQNGREGREQGAEGIQSGVFFN